MNRDSIIEAELARFARLVVILENWAEWNSRYVGLHHTSHSVGLTSGYGASKTFEDMLADIENSVAQLVEAAIDDLPTGQVAAINRRYGLCAVFRFPRGNYEDLLLQAHETLMKTLPKKGVVI